MPKTTWIDLPFSTIDKRETVNICSGCLFKKEEKIGFAPFEIFGEENPEILFVAEAPFKDEIKKQRPLIGKAGTFLREVLDDLQLKNYALANIVCCHQTLGSPKVPPPHAQEYCVSHVKSFIKDIQPKLVVLLGKIAYMNLLPKDYLDAQLRDVDVVTRMQKLGPYQHEGIKYACSFHPSYLQRNGGKSSPQYQAFITRLRSLIGSVYGKTQQEPLEEQQTLDFDFYTLDQLPQILASIKEDTIGFDYETRLLDTWNTNNYPTGFAIAHRTSPRSGKAFYFIVDRQLSVTEKNLLLTFFKKKSPWTYNAKFEANLTWAKFGEFIRLNDAFTLCKIDGKPQSLKVNSHRYLNSTLWEEDVYSTVEYFKSIFSLMEKHKKKYPAMFLFLQKGEYKKADQLANEDTKSLKAFSSIFENINILIQNLGEDAVVKGLQAFPYEWAAVPYHILGEYCCWDAFNTVQIKEHLWNDYSSYYKYYITQTWLAGVQEAFGINWDDQKAKDLNQYYMNEAIQCLVDLIDLLDLEDEKILEAHQISNDPSFKGSPNARLTKLKTVFNPLSNKIESQQPFWNAYRTPETELLSLFQSLEMQILESAEINDEIALPLINKEDLTISIENILHVLGGGNTSAGFSFTKILGRLQDNVNFYMQRFASEILEFHYRAHTKYGGVIKFHCKECKFCTDDTIEKNKCPNCGELLQCGVDINNPNTWTKEFKMLYLLKRFKKVCKSDSTYVWGKIGRGNVHLARYDTISEPPTRLGGYYEVGGENYQLQENERWILNTNFFENGAECLVGETEIRLTNGQTITIEDAYTQQKTGLEIFSVKSEKIVSREVSDIIVSGYVNELIELELENEKTLRCTPDHRFLLKDGCTYKRAMDLTREDDLLDFDVNVDFFLFCKKNGIIKQSSGEWKLDRHSHNRLKKFKTEYKTFLEKTNWLLDDTFTRRFYHCFYTREIPNCPVCRTQVTFKNFYVGYNRTCSASCGNIIIKKMNEKRFPSSGERGNCFPREFIAEKVLKTISTIPFEYEKWIKGASGCVYKTNVVSLDRKIIFEFDGDGCNEIYDKKRDLDLADVGYETYRIKVSSDLTNEGKLINLVSPILSLLGILK